MADVAVGTALCSMQGLALEGGRRKVSKDGVGAGGFRTKDDRTGEGGGYCKHDAGTADKEVQGGEEEGREPCDLSRRS